MLRGHLPLKQVVSLFILTSLWVGGELLTAWTGDGMDRFRRMDAGMDTHAGRHGPSGRFVGYAATSHPDGSDSRPDAGSADEYLADPARSQIRLRQGVRRPLGYTRQNARRPVLVLRESAASALRSGASGGAVGLRTRKARLRPCGATAIPPADTPPHSSPSTPRRPAPVTRPLRRRTPVQTLASPF